MPDDLARTLSLLMQEKQGSQPYSVSTLLASAGVSLPMTPDALPDPAISTRAANSNLIPRFGVAGLPAQLGRHELVAEIGRGGMGRVIAARDPDLRRTVAVKVVADLSGASSEALARFVGEAQITAQLEHPNIVPVHDLGITEQGQVYFVMKKVEGRSLRQVIASLRSGNPADLAHFTPRRLLALFAQVCNAVGYAHARGVLHRDLKPDNIMVGQFGEVLVMDWGVARVLGGREEPRAAEVQRSGVAATMEGMAVGTPGYMSPEQAGGELDRQDARSDVWSLGAILYELVTWERAFVGNNVYHLIFEATRSQPEPPRRRAPERGVPEAIAALALRALHPDPAMRPQSALELGAEVEDFLEGAKRREAAEVHLSEARAAWSRHAELRARRQALEAEEARLQRELPRWASLEDKAPLHAARQELRRNEPATATAFGDCLGHCEKALSQDPSHPGARALLAEVFFHHFEEAEARRDEAAQAHFAARVRQYDDGARFAAALRGLATVSVRSDPPSEVFAQRVLSESLVWGLGPALPLGRTPIEDVQIEHGSWVLTLRAEGKRDTIYPVVLERGGRWEGAAVPLYSEEEIGEGWVYVPPGPTRVGDDPLAVEAVPTADVQVDGFFAAVFPVTNREYLRFLNQAFPERSDARRHVPRRESHLDAGVSEQFEDANLYWSDASGRWELPPDHEDGDNWPPEAPVFSVRWDDALAYARWLGSEQGDAERYRLPLEAEWSKLARGVDGRPFPWGDQFDPALCKMRFSREGRSAPEPVGTFRTDRSVYGAHDLAGGIREFCAEDNYSGDPERRPVRGGSWRASEVPCRAAYRFGLPWWQLYTSIGFRLVRSEPLPSRRERRRSAP